MNKITYVVIIVCILVFGCKVKQTKRSHLKSDLAELKLKGKVKSWKRVECAIRDSTSDKMVDTLGAQIENWTFFNEAGNYTEEFYYSKGEFNSKTLWEYNNTGTKVIRKMIDYKGELYKVMTCLYDSNGNNTELDVGNDTATVSYREYMKYDKKGNEIEEKHYDHKYGLTNKKVMKYDSNNHQVEFIMYQSPDTNNSSYNMVFGYDSKGNLIKEDDFGFDGQQIMHRDLEYDKNNHLISDKMDNIGGKKEFMTWKNDAAGNPTDIIYFKGDESKPVFEMKKEYDKMGNEIKMVKWENGKITSIEECIIEYY